MIQPWQLLDRPVEFDAISSELRAGDRGGVILVGPAGVGKTTLAHRVTATLDAEVCWVVCTESSQSIPLGVFAHQVRSSGSRDPLALIAAARESLLRHPNTVIGVDDAYLLDDLSATLLHQIAIEGEARVIATIRSNEPVPDAVVSLWKDGYLKRFELTPLTRKQSIALVETVLGGVLEELSAGVMWDSSGGNPLFLRHMVEAAVEAGSLREVDGVWQLRGSTVMSSGLASLLEDRLGRLDDEVTGALRLLALCEPLHIDTLIELAGENAVDAAEAADLIRVARDGSDLNARFHHPLYGEVIRRRTGTASARRLRGRIAKALAERGIDRPADRIQRAQLYIDSDQSVGVDLFIRAAKDALSLSNLPLGERLARAAFEQGGGLEAGEVLSRALLWQGRPSEADDILATFDPNNLNELQLVQWGIPRVAILFWLTEDVDAAHSVMATLDERVHNSMLRLVVEATSSALAVHENRITEGLAAAEAVLADPLAPRQAIEFAAFSAGLAMPVAGRGHGFEPYATRCRADLRATDGMIRLIVRYGDVHALAITGKLDLADQRAASYAQFSSAGQRLGWAIAKIATGLVSTYRGRFRDAISALEQALAAMSADAPLPWRLPARLLLVRAYSGLGHVDQAERVLVDAKEHTGRSVALHDAQLLISKAWLAAARGADHAAIDLARAAAKHAHGVGQFAIEAEALHHCARFGDRSAGARLASLVQQVDGPVVNLQARHAIAVADADAGALDAVSRDFEILGFLLSAADSAAQAARLHERAKDRRRAAESSARATMLAALCGGAMTPSLSHVIQPLPITSREREIAMLISERLTNRKIAERLGVSVRTIEGHIYRACIKLDITDRDELGGIVRPDQRPDPR